MDKQNKEIANLKTLVYCDDNKDTLIKDDFLTKYLVFKQNQVQFYLS